MAKIKEIKAQNPNYVIDLVDILAKADPSKTNKYLPFMVSQTKDWMEWFTEELTKNTFKEMFEIVEDFHDLSERNLLTNKDIYSYESNQVIVDEIKIAREKVTRSEVKKKETLTHYEDDTWLVVQPLSSRSSNIYGKSTKWCVSSDDHNFKKYYNDYTKEGVLVFLIDKRVKEADTRKEENNHAKLAFHKYINKKDDLTVWNVKDTQLSVRDIMGVYKNTPSEVMDIIDKVIEGESNKSLADKKKVKE